MPQRRRVSQSPPKQCKLSALERRLEELLLNYAQTREHGFPEHGFLREHGIDPEDLKSPMTKEMFTIATMRELGYGPEEWMSPALEKLLKSPERSVRVAALRMARERALEELFESVESRLGITLSPTERERVFEECGVATFEEQLKATLAEVGLLEDKVNFGAVLALAEAILADARRLAEWAQDDQLDDTGAEMLLRMGERWLALESVLDANGIGAGKGHWCTDDDCVGDAASCLHNLACGVRKNAAWFRYLPGITNTCLLSLAPGACMGMPHAVFAKRLAVAVELLRKIAAQPMEGPNDHKEADGDPEHGPRVVLRGREEGPIVLGKTKRKLTKGQYNVVKALLTAGDLGLTKDELVSQSGHGDARMILTRLAQKDDWKEVIHFAGQTGGGYRIK